MRVTTLCLDAGGVLLHPDWDAISGLLRGVGIDADPARLRQAEPHARRALDRAEHIQATSDASRAAVYFEDTLRRAGYEVPRASMAVAWGALRRAHDAENLWRHVDHEVFAALRKVRAMGVRTVVVSNANGTVQLQLERVKIAPLVDAIVDSHLVGVEKPDPEIFRIALERVGGRPESALHVGDLYHVDVVGARAAGIEAWLFDPDDLYEDADCPRVRTLAEVAARLSG